LPGAETEAREIEAVFTEAKGEGGEVLALDGARASRAAVEETVPRARYLHVATHGWFAPELLDSGADSAPIDLKLGAGYRMTAGEHVRGNSPLLLCGLALAGANLAPDSRGHVPGLVTAEEISTWDLSSCELAVLSACDTNVGVRTAGQGVASLQKALHMAGASSVITSLWKVPDEATRLLMVGFYKRLWTEGKPKREALWEAKKALREKGHPTRDWAAWVVSGER
jgi:CHAT domain-containing protein